MQHLDMVEKGRTMDKYIGVLARILLASIFLGAVTIRLISIQSAPDGYAQYLALLAHLGLPGLFAPLLILIQLLGGLALLVGFKTRIFAYVMAGFSLFLALVLGQLDFSVMFLYLGLTGGLLMLALNPVTACSLDSWKK
jgi:putative oxidoreductase